MKNNVPPSKKLQEEYLFLENEIKKHIQSSLLEDIPEKEEKDLSNRIDALIKQDCRYASQFFILLKQAAPKQQDFDLKEHLLSLWPNLKTNVYFMQQAQKDAYECTLNPRRIFPSSFSSVSDKNARFMIEKTQQIINKFKENPQTAGDRLKQTLDTKQLEIAIVDSDEPNAFSDYTPPKKQYPFIT